jgi:hypothetical protein
MNKIEKLLLNGTDNFLLQDGTIPVGVTSSGSKYAMHNANVAYDVPSVYPQTYQPLIPFTVLDPDFKIVLDDNWKQYIHSGDPIQLRRGNIVSEYSVQYAKYDANTNETTVKLSNFREYVNLLDPFISLSGYPNPSGDSYVSLDRKLESPNTLISGINSFVTKMISPTNTEFLLKVTWDLDPSISAGKLRWRSLPRNYVSSELSFTVDQGGEYSEIPTANVISTTGRNCLLKLQGVVQSVTVDESGSGYTYANAVCNPDNGTTLSVILSGDSIDSIDVISSNYFESRPEIIITGDGVGGVAHVSSLGVDDLQILQQGSNYLSAPTVEVVGNVVGLTATEISSTVNTNNDGRVDYIRILDGGYGYTGANVSVVGGSTDITATVSITNGSITSIDIIDGGNGYPSSTSVVILPIGTSGAGAQAVANVDIFSQWVYVDIDVNTNSVTIPGFKYNIPYEIEILASEDPNFRGLNKYTNNSQFQYYK